MPFLLGLTLALGPKLAVNNFEAGAGADPQVATLLTSEFASTLRHRTTATVITQADLRAMIGFERQRQLLNCGDSHCLAEIGGALGVDGIVTGSLGRIGDTAVFSVRLLDVRKGAVTRDFSRRLRSAQPEALLDAVDAAVSALFPEALPLVPAQALSIAAPSPKRSVVTPWVAAGAGGAIAIAGGIVWGLAAGRAQLSDGATNLTYGHANGVNAEGELGQGLLIGGLVVAAAAATWGILSVEGSR